MKEKQTLRPLKEREREREREGGRAWGREAVREIKRGRKATRYRAHRKRFHTARHV